MSHFYGRVQGGRGEAHRCGHKSSGLRVEAATWGEKIETQLSHDHGRDYATVLLRKRDGTPVVLYSGEINVGETPPDMPVPAFTLKEINQAQDEVAGS